MASRTAGKEQRKQERIRDEEQARRRLSVRALRIRIVAGVAGALAVLDVIFALSNLGTGSSSGPKGSRYPFAVGQPGPRQLAPAINLRSTQGGKFSLATQRGKTTLLYFQEGISCQPCWDQLKDLQPHMREFKALGVSQIVSITTDPLDALHQKASDEQLGMPVLSDGDLAVSKAYGANQYGMMGDSRDGHSFVAVGPDGRIRWRADYGGSPKYTMYVPVATLLADLRKGLATSHS